MTFRKILTGGLVCALGVTLMQVNAKEYYYENNNGVKLTEQEYNFYTEMYWEGYQEYISKNDYDYFKNMNIFEQKVIKHTVNDTPLTRGATVTSHLRTLSISKACSEKCVISLVNRWNGNPTIKSYDVIGVRLKNVSLVSKTGVLVTGTNYSKMYNSSKDFDSGFGYSILVPNVDNIKATLTFTTTTGGTVYGSYQHAATNTTENISEQFSSI